MKNKYGVKFRYFGEEPTGLRKTMIERHFIDAYNRFCDAVNPNYEGWNAQYTGPDDGLDNNGCINPESQYNTYIRNLQNEAIDVCINTTMCFGWFEKFFSGAECQFCAKLKNGTVMDFFLEEAE